jgi:hypothetical protein
MAQLTEVFWVTFITTVSAMLIKIFSMCYKSKCRQVDFCCIKIIRDTAAEEKEEEYRIDHNQPSGMSPTASPSSRNLNDNL